MNIIETMFESFNKEQYRENYNEFIKEIQEVFENYLDDTDYIISCLRKEMIEAFEYSIKSYCTYYQVELDASKVREKARLLSNSFMEDVFVLKGVLELFYDMDQGKKWNYEENSILIKNLNKADNIVNIAAKKHNVILDWYFREGLEPEEIETKKISFFEKNISEAVYKELLPLFLFTWNDSLISYDTSICQMNSVEDLKRIFVYKMIYSLTYFIGNNKEVTSGGMLKSFESAILFCNRKKNKMLYSSAEINRKINNQVQLMCKESNEFVGKVGKKSSANSINSYVGDISDLCEKHISVINELRRKVEILSEYRLKDEIKEQIEFIINNCNMKMTTEDYKRCLRYIQDNADIFAKIYAPRKRKKEKVRESDTLFFREILRFLKKKSIAGYNKEAVLLCLDFLTDWVLMLQTTKTHVYDCADYIGLALRENINEAWDRNSFSNECQKPEETFEVFWDFCEMALEHVVDLLIEHGVHFHTRTNTYKEIWNRIEKGSDELFHEDVFSFFDKVYSIRRNKLNSEK